MPELKIEADAAEVGMDEARLRRLGTHFRRYVDDGRLPGWLMLVARQGKVVFLETYGQRDLEAGLPVELDTVFRIYSMTKPITTVAAMMLWEEGGFELKDPVHRFIPSFQDTRVWRTGSINNFTTDAQRDPIAVWNLMSHTSGLTYGFLHAHPIDELYRRAGFEWGVPPDADLAELCDTFASFPLLFQPGTEWNYSVATDVLGRVVEVVSGQSLDDFMRARIFEPLGMTDTGFWATDDKRDRLAALYAPNPADRKALRFDELGEVAHSRPSAWLGGGGLVSTAHDYYR
ncbi:MAG TPA: serine hydrolase domain-containing protein, partial [Acidimicrobiales bacterium]